MTQETRHSTTKTDPPRPYNGQIGAMICGGSAILLIGVIATLAALEGASDDHRLSPVTSALIVGLVQSLLLVAFIVLSTRHAQGSLFRQTEAAERRHDERADALVSELGGRLHAVDHRLDGLEEIVSRLRAIEAVLHQLLPEAEADRLRDYEREFVDRLHDRAGAGGAAVRTLRPTS